MSAEQKNIVTNDNANQSNGETAPATLADLEVNNAGEIKGGPSTQIKRIVILKSGVSQDAEEGE